MGVKEMRKYKIIFALFLLLLASCRISEKQLANEDALVKLPSISPTQFFEYRMRNSNAKGERYEWVIVKENSEYVFLGQKYRLHDAVEYKKVYKCRKDLLVDLFPAYHTFDGVQAGGLILDHTAQYNITEYSSILEQDYHWTPFLEKDYILFKLKWDYSIDKAPWVRRTFEIYVDKHSMEKVHVIQSQ